MSHRALLVLLALLLGLPALAPAAEWTVEDVVAQDYATGFQVSPDGRWAVWSQRGLAEDGKVFRWQLTLTSLDVANGPQTPRQLTRAAVDSRGPRFSPDGRRLAFLSARPAPGGESDDAPDSQIWLLDLSGGEAEAVTEHPGGVQDFAWIGSDRLLYLAGEAKTLREQNLEDVHDDTEVVGDEDHVPPARLFTLTLGGEAKRLTDNATPIQDMTASPDGKRAIVRLARSIHDDYDFRTPPDVMLVDLSTGAMKEILPAAIRADGFVWDLNSKGFSFLRPEASDSTDLYVSLYALGHRDLDAKTWRPVPLGWDRGLDGLLFATSKGVLAGLADGLQGRLVHYERKGDSWKRQELSRPERGVETLLAAGPDGETVLLAHGNASLPDRYYVGRLDGKRLKDRREFLRLSTHLANLPIPRSEPFYWVGARGDTVEGMLTYPFNYDPETDDRYPLVVMLHGGPGDADRDRFDESWAGSAALLAQRGAAVLKPNYHGSYGYGLEWLESIKGHYYELEVPDILAGVDALVQTGLADASRLGILGWSNGAILGIAACLESGERFRALAAGAGDVNWTSDYGNCAFGAGFDNAYFGGPPWALPDVYLAKSPLFRMQDLRVPTLISIGSADTNVPAEQGQELYRALQQIGEAPVRFLRFPDQPHTLGTPAGRRRQLTEQLAWFDRWLFESPLPAENAYRDDSPLARALAVAAAASVDGYFGERLDDLLVPELVQRDALLVGRFEVTRAQWASYRGEPWPVDRREGNLPITGISAADARAYCAWVGKRLALDCRLPVDTEWESLAGTEDAKPGAENTLSWWAGHAPNPEDRATLAAGVDLLTANRSLLEPVGSFAAADGLYDLGGNAAEWVEDAAGKASPRGLCAVTAPDPYGAPPAAPDDYVGLRVVAPAPPAERAR
ncbi:MAG: prolyl oligopeptidase family serine peptidase [Candidatus Krumholzibacteriia bacterium]|nr:prolyl oligopeptidase family serine peptidase [bacterium]MCB9515443.1 prolyl oligopeptidase family serine peptidase [Candidatus Latescibacterota bacterium]